jgi:hypothetical protein
MEMIINLIESLQPTDAIEAALASQFAITYIRGLEESLKDYSNGSTMFKKSFIKLMRAHVMEYISYN